MPTYAPVRLLAAAALREGRSADLQLWKHLGGVEVEEIDELRGAGSAVRRRTALCMARTARDTRVPHCMHGPRLPSHSTAPRRDLAVWPGTATKATAMLL
jgi:hypothetical protein